MDKKSKQSPLSKGTKISLYAADSFIGKSTEQLSKYSSVIESYGENITPSLISKKQPQLTKSEFEVLEQVLHYLTQLDYKGNAPTPTCSELLQKGLITEEEYKEESSYESFVKLKFSKEEFFRLMGIKKNAIAERERRLKDLESLSEKKFAFCYETLSLDENGIPIRNTKNKLEKTLMIRFSSIFDLGIQKCIKTGREWLHVIPSEIFLSQLNKHFLVLPEKFRLVLKKRDPQNKSKYMYRFLLLIYKTAEYHRRYNKGSNLVFNLDNLVSSLHLPESYFKRQKSKLKSTLGNLVSYLKNEGIVKEWSITEMQLNLSVQSKYFYDPTGALKEIGITKEDSLQAPQSQKAEEAILNFFYTELEKRGVKKQKPKGSVKDSYLKKAASILDQEVSVETIKSVLTQSLEDKYWSSKCSTFGNFIKNFDAMFLSLRTKKEVVLDTDTVKLNKKLAQTIEKKLSKNNKLNIFGVSAGNSHIEIYSTGGAHPKVFQVSYSEPEFKSEVSKSLNNFKTSLDSILKNSSEKE
jgi:hypothetical protein